MTESKHPLVGEEGKEKAKEQSHSASENVSDDVFRSRKEAEEHDADIADRHVRRDTENDFRRMRQLAVASAIILPLVLPMLLSALMALVGGFMDVAVVEAMITPLTALVIGGYATATAIYSALLFGLFRSSASREREAWANMHPFISVLLKALGKG